MYDRVHDKSPDDFRKSRSNRARQADIWQKIYDQSRLHTVPLTQAHCHGDPNRKQTDFPDSTFFRTKTIQDNFYRRKDVNVPPVTDTASLRIVCNWIFVLTLHCSAEVFSIQIRTLLFNVDLDNHIQSILWFGNNSRINSMSTISKFNFKLLFLETKIWGDGKMELVCFRIANWRLYE